MSGVVCAIRGGPSSQQTVKLAIQQAQKTDSHLYFLYVVNLAFLSHTEISRTSLISRQMHQMGEFILLDAQAKAAAQNVTAEAVVRHGEVTEEIVALAKEIQAEHIILGQPEGVDEENVFTLERLDAFCKRLTEESGAQVLIAEGEEE
jgi:nucleotide-binding universal stress UspA family protein